MTPGSTIASVRELAGIGQQRSSRPCPARGGDAVRRRKQRLVDPALAVGIAHAPPVVVFLDDLHRQAGLQIEPVHRIIFARSDARIDAAGLQADETRQRQAARASPHVLRALFGGSRHGIGDGLDRRDQGKTGQRNADGQAKRRKTKHPRSFGNSAPRLEPSAGAPFFFVIGRSACYTGSRAGACFQFHLSWLKRSEAGAGSEARI